jgi:hypothetical protein
MTAQYLLLQKEKDSHPEFISGSPAVMLLTANPFVREC